MLVLEYLASLTRLPYQIIESALFMHSSGGLDNSTSYVDNGARYAQ